MNHTTRAVILRSGHHGGLGIVRSLGRLGVPVYSVDADWWEPAFSSRYCRGRFLLDTENLPAGRIHSPPPGNRTESRGPPDSDPHHRPRRHLGGGARRGPAGRILLPSPGCRAGPHPLRQKPHAGARPPKRRAYRPDRSSPVETGCGAVSRNRHLPRHGEGDGRGPLAPARRRHQVRHPHAPRTARPVRQGRRPRGTQPDDSGIHPRR